MSWVKHTWMLITLTLGANGILPLFDSRCTYTFTHVVHQISKLVVNGIRHLLFNCFTCMTCSCFILSSDTSPVTVIMCLPSKYSMVIQHMLWSCPQRMVGVSNWQVCILGLRRHISWIIVSRRCTVMPYGTLFIRTLVQTIIYVFHADVSHTAWRTSQDTN